MSPQTGSDESKLVRLIERTHFKAEDKARWIEIIQNGDLSEDVVKEIRAALSDLPAENAESGWDRARALTELTGYVRRWRLSQNLRNTGRGRR